MGRVFRARVTQHEVCFSGDVASQVLYQRLTFDFLILIFEFRGRQFFQLFVCELGQQRFDFFLAYPTPFASHFHRQSKFVIQLSRIFATLIS